MTREQAIENAAKAIDDAIKSNIIVLLPGQYTIMTTADNMKPKANIAEAALASFERDGWRKTE